MAINCSVASGVVLFTQSSFFVFRLHFATVSRRLANNSTKQAFSVVIIYSPNTGSGRPSSHQSAIRVFVDH
jgi:hypothetical protein